MVENRSHHYPERGRLIKTSDDVRACRATEAILFERTTFLVIATSPPPDGPEQANGPELDSVRAMSELIKALKYSCARIREESRALEMELPGFTAVL